jgi:3-hydroxyacyl-[acyl-carrier-protein] dehydratase
MSIENTSLTPVNNATVNNVVVNNAVVNNTVNGFDIHEILKKLPHRYPMILVDRVESLIAGESIVALKNVTMNEPFFQGHFPKYPVMPGVLILEALAQAAALLGFATLNIDDSANALVLFVGIDGARFKRQVVPGDQLKLYVKPTRTKGGIWKFSAQAKVNDELACEAELMCTYRA